jgi:hypothetical protein
MGFELANVHLGNPRAAGIIRRDLDGRRGKWLRTASDAMAREIVADWKDWKRAMA